MTDFETLDPATAPGGAVAVAFYNDGSGYETALRSVAGAWHGTHGPLRSDAWPALTFVPVAEFLRVTGGREPLHPTPGQPCLGLPKFAELAREVMLGLAEQPRWTEGWYEAMRWLRDENGRVGAMLATEMKTRLPEHDGCRHPVVDGVCRRCGQGGVVV